MSEILQIKNACIAFDKEILFSGFNLSLERGEIICISGHSGKGKTSLLNAVMGFVPLLEGTIIINGILLNKQNIDAVRKNIAWIPQQLAIPAEWVKEMIRLPFNLKLNRKIRFNTDKLFSNFQKLGLEDNLYDKRVAEISGGQRQRVMLAVASMLEKPLIIIDEPTSALDVDSMDKVLSFFRERAEGGAAILAVSHDKGFASGCDKQVFL